MENSALTQMWETRPPRIPENQGGKAVIGGVCEGIGARFNIDPTFIRVVFVALSLAFGGGIFLYLLCWINMPRFGLTRSPWAAIITPKEQLTAAEIKDRDTGWLLLLGLFLFLPSVSVAGDLRAVLVTFILFAAGWYFLHQRQPEPPTGLLVGEPEGARTSNRAAVDTSHLTVPEGHEHPGQRPPAWDPLGTAPELWHLPEPSEPAPTQPKKRNWTWIPVALVLSAVSLVGLAFYSDLRDGDYGRFGSANITVYDIDTLPDQPGVNGFVGETYLDLSELEPLREPKTVEVSNTIGKVDVILPNNVPVDVNCQVTIGETACPEETQNADKDSALLTINVTQRVGSVSAYYAR